MPEDNKWVKSIGPHFGVAEDIYDKAIELGADPVEALTTSYHESSFNKAASSGEGGMFKGPFQLGSQYNIDRTDPSASTEAWWKQRSASPHSGYEYYRREHNLGAPAQNTMNMYMGSDEYDPAAKTKSRKKLTEILVSQPVFGRALADKFGVEVDWKKKGWNEQKQALLNKARAEYNYKTPEGIKSMIKDFQSSQGKRWEKSESRAKDVVGLIKDKRAPIKAAVDAALPDVKLKTRKLLSSAAQNAIQGNEGFVQGAATAKAATRPHPERVGTP